MSARFLNELFTPEVLEAQQRTYGRNAGRPEGVQSDALTPDEAAFLAERDSFYLSTVTSEGWPYVQHRGGAPGFIHVLDPRTIAFVDLKGNRQLISAGNLSADADGSLAKVALIAVDYPRRERLKILGRGRVEWPEQNPELFARLAVGTTRKGAERIVVIDIVATDWNCPAYITPRFTIPEIEAMARPLKERVAELEAEVAALKQKR